MIIVIIFLALLLGASVYLNFWLYNQIKRYRAAVAQFKTKIARAVVFISLASIFLGSQLKHLFTNDTPNQD